VQDKLRSDDSLNTKLFICKDLSADNGITTCKLHKTYCFIIYQPVSLLDDKIPANETRNDGDRKIWLWTRSETKVQKKYSGLILHFHVHHRSVYHWSVSGFKTL